MISEIQKAACLSHAARLWLPPARTGNPLHPSVLARWSDRGILVNGARIFLHTWRVGGQRMTTQAAVEEFIAALNAGSPTAEADNENDMASRANQACMALEKLGA